MPDFAPYDPPFDDPYPPEWQALSDFRYETPLRLARAETALGIGDDREAEYIVADEYVCTVRVDGTPWPLRVPCGMLTDLASVPRLGRVAVGRTGPHLEASILHDFLFIAWQSLPGRGPRERDFAFANAVMLEAMAAAGIGWIKRQAVFLAVSSPFGRAVFREREGAARFVRVPGSPGCAG